MCKVYELKTKENLFEWAALAAASASLAFDLIVIWYDSQTKSTRQHKIKKKKKLKYKKQHAQTDRKSQGRASSEEKVKTRDETSP